MIVIYQVEIKRNKTDTYEIMSSSFTFTVQHIIRHLMAWNLHLVLFSLLITDSKPEWPWGSALWESTKRAELCEQSDKVSGWEILAPARPHRSATMCSDMRQVQIDCCCNWLRQHRNTWVYLSLHSQTNCCQSSLGTLLQRQSLNKLT